MARRRTRKNKCKLSLAQIALPALAVGITAALLIKFLPKTATATAMAMGTAPRSIIDPIFITTSSKSIIDPIFKSSGRMIVDPTFAVGKASPYGGGGLNVSPDRPKLICTPKYERVKVGETCVPENKIVSGMKVWKSVYGDLNLNI